MNMMKRVHIQAVLILIHLRQKKHFYIPPKLKVKKLKSLLVSGDLMYLYNIYTYICNTYVYICKMTNKASAYMRDDEYFWINCCRIYPRLQLDREEENRKDEGADAV